MSAMATLATATIGFPRIGNRRQMKFALEKFWKGQSTEAELIQTTAEVQAVAWNEQKQAGIERVGLDGTLYDQVLDTTMWLGLAPARFQHLNGLAQYFAMARGAKGCIAQDMSKFFDTNYHYVVPELEAGFQPKPQLQHVLEKVARGQAAVGKEHAVPIIIGPVTYAYLAKRAEGLTIEAAVSALLPAYVAMLRALSELAVPEVQIHEPALVVEAAKSHRALYEATYKTLSEQAGGVPLHLITYFDDLGEAYPWAVQLPVQAVYLDFLGVPGASVPNQTLSLLKTHGFPADKKLFAGVADGRSVWADDGTAMAIVSELLAGGHVSADRLGITSSAPLQLLPYDLRLEDQQVLANTPCLTRGGQVIGQCLSFALQKLDEIVATAKAGAALAANPAAAATAKAQQAAGAAAETGVFEVDSQLLVRPEPYQARRAKQIKMPAFPTTTIGSFPQTAEVRRLRQQWKSGAITQEEYDRQITGHIAYCIGVQDALGIDVLVHGESERTDMVEYFGIKLEGMLFTQAGWVQSYGSRYVRPPIVASDIAFKEPMTVKEYLVAQSFTSKPVKGMLTGPVTILNWSFPRKDITRRQQALQLAAALRQEVAALEAAGCKIIQVDDPALREGLPLKAARWQSYLSWAVDAFRMCTAVAAPETQIVTHLCYSDFEDIMEAIDAMDADVLTIENSRSDNAMIAALAGARYGRDIGPGVYDVHSPVVPPVDFIKSRIKSFVDTGILGGAASADRIWVNPDCGLKTRGWQETIPALRNMVQAAAEARTELLAGGGATGGHSCGTGAGGAAYGGSAMPSAGGAVTTCCRCCLE